MLMKCPRMKKYNHFGKKEVSSVYLNLAILINHPIWPGHNYFAQRHSYSRMETPDTYLLGWLCCLLRFVALRFCWPLTNKKHLWLDLCVWRVKVIFDCKKNGLQRQHTSIEFFLIRTNKKNVSHDDEFRLNNNLLLIARRAPSARPLIDAVAAWYFCLMFFFKIRLDSNFLRKEMMKGVAVSKPSGLDPTNLAFGHTSARHYGIKIIIQGDPSPSAGHN